MKPAVFLFVLLWSWNVAAQEKMSSEQTQLYSKATKAYQSGDYSSSIELLTKAILIEPYGILFFGRGQAYRKQGNCSAAFENYEAASNAPKLVEGLEEQLQSAVDELYEACPASLKIVCVDPSTTVSLNGDELAGCSNETLVLDPGTYVVFSKLGDLTDRKVFTLRGMDNVLVEIELKENQVSAPPQATQPSTRWLSFATGGLGLALGATFFALDFSWVKSRREELENVRLADTGDSELQNALDAYTRARTTNLVIGVSSVALITFATVWFFVTDDESVALSATHESLAVKWQW